MIRSHLRKAFPGTKFTVRSNWIVGGSHIEVTWCDGPVQSAVDAVLDLYAGYDLDVLDNQVVRDRYVKDGRAVEKSDDAEVVNFEYIAISRRSRT